MSLDHVVEYSYKNNELIVKFDPLIERALIENKITMKQAIDLAAKTYNKLESNGIYTLKEALESGRITLEESFKLTNIYQLQSLKPGENSRDLTVEEAALFTEYDQAYLYAAGECDPIRCINILDEDNPLIGIESSFTKDNSDITDGMCN